MFANLLTNVKGTLRAVGGVAYKHLPKILAITGGGLVAGGSVYACISCVKHARIVYEAQDRLQSIDAYWDEIRGSGAPNSYTLKDYRNDRWAVIFNAAVEFGKHLIVPGGMVATGGVFIGTAFHVIDQRYATATAMLEFLASDFMRYRDAVKEDLGEEADQKYMNARPHITDEKGLSTGVYSEGMSGANQDPGDIYTFYFRKGNKYWDDNPYYNILFLINEQRTLCNQLSIDKSMFRSEVVKALGGTVEEGDIVYPRDNMVGWKVGNGDGFIDFGIFDKDGNLKPWVKAYMESHDDVIPIHLNCDGNILKHLSLKGAVKK